MTPEPLTLMDPSFDAWSPTQDPARQCAVMMSGGVDSSVAAHLLKRAGWDVVGVTMKIPITCSSGKRGCCGADAALVCHELGIAHYYVDATEMFRHHIIDAFQAAYADARTPNPCVDCNSVLKFWLLWDLLEEAFGVSAVATGHYAQVCFEEGKARLCRGKDEGKDQSYFLYGIKQERLSRLLLPLGGLTKREVRAVAAEIGLCVADKAESMELCFAGEGNYRDALTVAQARTEGALTDMQGNIIGTHRGIANYTLGQRKGLGFAGGRPLYVGRIDAAANTVALGGREEVCARVIEVKDLNVLDREGLIPNRPLGAKIRSYGEPKSCFLREVAEDRMTVEFDEPQFAPCPGQRLVLYGADHHVIGGGTIFLS